MRIRALLGGCILAIVAADGLAAQTCIGTASFATAPVRVAGAFTAADGAKGYSAQLAAGAPEGLFGVAALSRNVYDNIDQPGINTGVDAGYAVNLTPQRNLQFCPIVGFDYQHGPNVRTALGTIAASSRAGIFGGSLGGVIPASPTVDVVPFAGFSYFVTRNSSYGGGVSLSNSLNYEAVDAGVGIVINRVVTLQPAVSVPMGVKGGKTSFEVSAGYSFGRGK